MYYCYVLYSKEIDQTYIGSTNNLSVRLLKHRELPTRTTARANDYKLIWFCVFSSRKHAERFERYLKTGSGRAFMKRHITIDEALKKSIDHSGISSEGR